MQRKRILDDSLKASTSSLLNSTRGEFFFDAVEMPDEAEDIEQSAETDTSSLTLQPVSPPKKEEAEEKSKNPVAVLPAPEPAKAEPANEVAAEGKSSEEEAIPDEQIDQAVKTIPQQLMEKNRKFRKYLCKTKDTPLVAIPKEDAMLYYVKLKEKNILRSQVVDYALIVSDRINHAVENKLVSTDQEYQCLIDTIDKTYNAVAKPSAQSRKALQEIASKVCGHRKIGRLVGGILMMILGALLITASVLAGYFSGGFASPLTIFGCKLGVELIIAGAAIATTLALVSMPVGFFLAKTAKSTSVAEGVVSLLDLLEGKAVRHSPSP